MSEPTEMPIPQEVPSSPALVAHLRWMRGQYPSDGQVGSILWREVHGPAAEELRRLQHQATLAALAATLVPERLEKLRHIFETHRDVHPVNSTEQLVAVYALEVLTAYTALVASGGEPLTAERVAELLLFEDECDGSDDRFAQRVYSALRDYRDAYTALAADLAALRARVAEVTETMDELAKLRCSDGHCELGGPAAGMHTNGGCHCLTDVRPFLLRKGLTTLLRKCRALAAPARPTDTAEGA